MLLRPTNVHSEALPAVRAVHHHLTGWCCLISRVRGIASMKRSNQRCLEMFPLGTINPHRAWMNTVTATKSQPFRLECLHAWTSHFSLAVSLLKSVSVTPAISTNFDLYLVEPFFFCLFPVRETVMEAHQSINRRQVAAAHFLFGVS